MKLKMICRFRSDRRGAVGILFGLMAIPVIGAVGIAIDYTRANAVKTVLQTAVDQAALTAARQPNSMSHADVAREARRLFDVNMKSQSEHFGTLTSFEVRPMANGFLAQASINVPTTFAAVLGYRSMNVGASGTAQRGSKKVEVVLALDNTGSMQGTRLSELKRASRSLVNILEDAVVQTGDVKIGLVPFATSVRVSPAENRNRAWIDFSDGRGYEPQCWMIFGYRICGNPPGDVVDRVLWNGCIQDREAPRNTTDAPVVAGSYATMYTAIMCRQSEGAMSFVQPLTTNFPNVRTAINGMVAGGNTNVTIGVVWGHALLSAQEPYTEAVPYTEKDVQKFLILLTDGENTQDRIDHCNHRDQRNPTACVQRMNTRTLAACEAAKNAAGADPARITIFSIRVMEGDSAMLSQCSSGSGRYFDVQSATRLDGVFTDIANEITNLRITN